jgi:hypothetical protein
MPNHAIGAVSTPSLPSAPASEYLKHDVSFGGGGNSLGWHTTGLKRDRDDSEDEGEGDGPGLTASELENVVKLVKVVDTMGMECQVDSCGKDLVGLKDYHQRYRICEVHIKLPQVSGEVEFRNWMKGSSTAPVRLLHVLEECWRAGLGKTCTPSFRY